MTIVENAIGSTEIMIVAGVIVLLFGARKVPEMMRGVGEGMKEFKKASKEVTEDKSDSTEPKAS